MNIAFEISPLITASGSFGDKSGVYRYTYGLITSFSELLRKKDKSVKIVLFTFNRDLLMYPLNPEILELLNDPNIQLLEKPPYSRSESLRLDEIFDISFLKSLYRVFRSIFHINIRQIYAQYLSSVRFHQYIKFLEKEFQEYDIDIIYHSETGFFPLSGFKNVITIYDSTAILHPEFHRGETIDLQTRKIRFAKKYCNGIVCISQSTKKDYQHLVGNGTSQKICVCYPGLDLVFQQQSSRDVIQGRDVTISDLNQILGRKKNQIKKRNYFLYVGTFEPRKNLIYLVKAFVDLQMQGDIPKDFKLVMVGGEGWGGIKNIIRNFIRERFPLDKKNNVIILDYLNDAHVIAFIKNAYAVIYPSLYEGFGLPVLESMALGAPVICCANSSLPEVGGDAVLYVRSNDFFDLKGKMKYLLHNPDLRKQMMERGILQSRKFTWEKSAQILYEFFQRL